MRTLRTALTRALWLALPLLPTPAAAQDTVTIRLTHYYPTGSAMADGQMPYYGAAACARRFPRGTTVVFPDGWSAECRDTGHLDANGVDVDLYAPTAAAGADFLARYGDHVRVTILR